MQVDLLHGDCLEVMKTLPDNSVDSIVTDPPYELGFMGKAWDNTGIANNPLMWAECLRVLKPGGHLLSFGGTRTYHRMAVAIEDAGFEVRDMIEWIYGSGFPKSLNIGKAVDKLQGNEREVTGKNDNARTNLPDKDIYEAGIRGKEALLTKGTSSFEGWGTALKPAHEPIVMARKPLSVKTVALNVLKHGTGGINIDKSRVEANWKAERPESWFNRGKSKSGNPTYDGNLKSLTKSTVGERLHDAGRFPANLIHDNSEEVRECFPESKSTGGTGEKSKGKMGTLNWEGQATGGFGDSGNSSRFFKSIIYTAKASKSERDRGCDTMPEVEKGTMDDDNYQWRNDVPNGRSTSKPMGKNFHPTVKPIALMEYLINMVTPPGGVVLDPFMGSGSTGVAAKDNGFSFIGIELDEEYIEIAQKRIDNVAERLL